MQLLDQQYDSGYDVVVIGGGAAGLSGALMLGRARRSVLVIDGGEPRNAPASAVHGFLSRDGIAPAALLKAARDDLRPYGVEIKAGEVVTAERDENGFVVALAGGTSFSARRLLVATGTVDELPDVPGVRERWGRDVLHCPYCHGWEVQDEPIGVLATGAFSVNQALQFRQWTDDVTLFLHTASPPSEDEAEQFAARGITVVAGEVASLEIEDDRLVGVRLVGGEVMSCRALVVAPRFVARGAMLAGLGLELTSHPWGMGDYVAADSSGLTAVPGVWVAGNVTDPVAQVVGAASGAVLAAASLNADLIAEETRHAVAVHRERMLVPVGA